MYNNIHCKQNILLILYDIYINHFFSDLPVYRAFSENPFTETILNLTPGISPFDLPFLPKPATKTSSLSLIKLRHPSPGTNADIFF